jgi:hypothetical protein
MQITEKSNACSYENGLYLSYLDEINIVMSVCSSSSNIVLYQRGVRQTGLEDICSDLHGTSVKT